jgi:hypothetical protein
LLTLTSMDSLGHIHEVLTGDTYRPQAQSVPEQSWSTAGFLDSTVHGLLGLHIDSITSRLRFSPSIPATWNGLSIGNIKIGGRSVSLVLHCSADRLTLRIENSGIPFEMDFAPNLPLGAKLIHANYDDHPIDAKIEEFPQQTRARVEMEVPHGISELSLGIAGGVSVLAEDYVPIPGHSSAGIRIVEVHLTGAQLTIEADVPTGRASRLKFQTTWKLKGSGNSVSRQIAPNLFELTFAPDSNAHAPYRRARATLNFDR